MDLPQDMWDLYTIVRWAIAKNNDTYSFFKFATLFISLVQAVESASAYSFSLVCGFLWTFDS